MAPGFTEEHDLFRRTVRTFCEKELAPNADAWERDEMFPDWVFKRAGELGILGAHYPEAHGGAGGDYWFSVAKGEELPRGGSAGGARRPRDVLRVCRGLCRASCSGRSARGAPGCTPLGCAIGPDRPNAVGCGHRRAARTTLVGDGACLARTGLCTCRPGAAPAAHIG